MTPWRVEFRPSAERALSKLPVKVQVRIVTALDRLASSGEGDVKKLEGATHDWRLWVGDYRVIFRREGDRLVILVLDVGHRREVYRG